MHQVSWLCQESRLRFTPQHTLTARECLTVQGVAVYDKTAAARGEGISSYVLPRSNRPVFFFRVPPHCLKKKGTFCSMHWDRIASTHCCRMGRARGPDSPPTITHE